MGVYDPAKVENEITQFWDKHKIPETIVTVDPKKPKYYLLDGPPYVNDKPHVGHIKTTTLKDIWGKFKYMQGHAVWFQPGFDCGGLPIENKVEKKLKLTSKQDIEKLGVDKFIAACNDFASGNQEAWLTLYKQLGAWRGWLAPYLTSDNQYLESGWWAVKQWYEKGLLIEGVKPGFWCSHCETVLAGYEVSDSYKTIEDPSVFLRFAVKGKEHEYLLVWTTTPWTLPANVVIAVHPDEPYVRAQVGDRVYILAQKRLAVLEDKPKILETFPGKLLDGLRYEPLLDVPLQQELDTQDHAHRIVLSIPLLKKRVASKTAIKKTSTEKESFGHIVDMETGTGLVHIAPGHGLEDNRLGTYYNLPTPSPVDEQGKMTSEAGPFAGMSVKHANDAILEVLDHTGNLFHLGTISHPYPLCWRCKTPLLYRMSRQWFLKMDTIRDTVRAEAEKTNWLPPFSRDRFLNLLADAPDWAITRQRYWGIPMPIWECTACDRRTVVGSKHELQERATTQTKIDDLHKHVVDTIMLRCDCGGEMKRVSDILDVWFDSGISPWASLHYPFENKALFERFFPVDLIDESQDQIRGWFYTLMLCGVATFGKRPYETVCLNGWMLDENGQKMSKSLGNVTWAADAHKRLGSDVLRLYYCSDIAPWDTQKFSERNAKDVGRTLNILWNVAEFTKTYAQQDAHATLTAIEDCWLQSRRNSVITTVTEALDTFAFHIAGRTLIDFVLNDLSRWYIKAVRDRVAPASTPASRAAASMVLYDTLSTVLRLLAPITPFLAEKLWQDLFGKGSVHTQPWPDDKAPDTALEAQMAIAKQVVDAIIAKRQEQNIKLRHPLSHVAITTDDKTKLSIEATSAVISLLGNVRTVDVTVGKGTGCVFGSLQLGDVLKDEALFREVVRFVQDLRKKQDLQVGDRIELTLSAPDLLRTKTEELKQKVGAAVVTFAPIPDPQGLLKLPEGTIKAILKKMHTT